MRTLDLKINTLIAFIPPPLIVDQSNAHRKPSIFLSGQRRGEPGVQENFLNHQVERT